MDLFSDSKQEDEFTPCGAVSRPARVRWTSTAGEQGPAVSSCGLGVCGYGGRRLEGRAKRQTTGQRNQCSSTFDLKAPDPH